MIAPALPIAAAVGVSVQLLRTDDPNHCWGGDVRIEPAQHREDVPRGLAMRLIP